MTIAAGGVSEIVRMLLRDLGVAVLVYFAFLTLTYMAITIASAIQIHRYYRRRSGVALLRLLRSRMTPTGHDLRRRLQRGGVDRRVGPGDADA